MSAITRYVAKPLEVEAVQWDGTDESADTIMEWVRSHGEPASRTTTVLMVGVREDVVEPQSWVVLSGGDLFVVWDNDQFAEMFARPVVPPSTVLTVTSVTGDFAVIRGASGRPVMSRLDGCELDARGGDTTVRIDCDAAKAANVGDRLVVAAYLERGS